MVKKEVVIRNVAGLHLRPSGTLCKEALKYKSKITFSIGNTTANAKSVLSVLGAGVKYGDEICIMCEGEDEEEAIIAITELIDSGLDE